MSRDQNQRRLFWIAAIAIGIALILLIVPHTHPGDSVAFLVILPIVFIGVLPSPCVMSRVDYMRLGYAPDAPALTASFQRPPPCLRA
jgi:predicted cobalt transporter CbtA